ATPVEAAAPRAATVAGDQPPGGKGRDTPPVCPIRRAKRRLARSGADAALTPAAAVLLGRAPGREASSRRQGRPRTDWPRLVPGPHRSVVERSPLTDNR